MTSEYSEAYVWIWLQGETSPVVAGRLEAEDGFIRFNYGRSYLERVEAGLPCMSIYEPELPLRRGQLPLLHDLAMPACIRDAAPDSWGRRVIIHRMHGLEGDAIDAIELDEMVALLESGSDRTGALDFQRSPTEYVPREAENPSLEELLEAAGRIERRAPLTPELDRALVHGTPIGGARPKALIQDQERGRKHIAKFSTSVDQYDMVKAEFVAMRLARLVGLDAAEVRLESVLGKDVLLVERFDREPSSGNGDAWTRRAMVSALAMQGLDGIRGRYASYEDMAQTVRERFEEPGRTLRELFSRLVFNILCGNTDDHGRNHAAFWNGRSLALTPAYDICPYARAGNEASQSMRILGTDNRSQLAVCLKAAPNFLLSAEEANAIFDHQIGVIEGNWDAVCDEAGLGVLERGQLWGRQFLNQWSLLRVN